ncbi:hypothetical protein KUTeg_021592 [Tegillarca granosa]|uniref:Adenylate kinase isoenzyme 5 n=1 Tax=Tegillarca granosa TaxID=220873 RepID=A0ABQ9E9V0_TEGGR|nr:hypothetical protein KUTeg_021592 [Tegillarca granosa]
MLNAKIPRKKTTYIRVRSGKMTTEDAKSYLSKREVPRLFESLMTGLMYHRPTDHIQYLIDCLEKVKAQGPDNITWSSFVDIRRTKTPLPPIPPENGKRPRSRPGSRPGSRTKTPGKIEGYPRDGNQVEEYDKVIGRLDMVVMLDAEEHTCTERLLKRGFETDNMEDNLRAISRRIAAFKQNTLPTCKHYDDLGMVHIVDAERDVKEVCKDVEKLFVNLISGAWKKDYAVHPSLKPEPKSPDTSEKKTPSDSTPTKKIDLSNMVVGVPQPPEIVNKDEGRKPNLPQCPILFLAGGPGSGKGVQGKKIVERYKGMVHLSIGDLLRSSVLDKGSAEDKWGAIGSLVEKGEMAPEFNGDRDIDEIFYDITQVLDMAFFGDRKKKAKDENSPKDDTQNKQEVNEEVIAPKEASTTGGGEGNPQHTAKLDEAAQQAQGSAG